MIKVIERGTKTIGECENCGCRFSYDKKDIKKDIKKDKLYGMGKLQAVISYIECPRCGKQHKVNKEE